MPEPDAAPSAYAIPPAQPVEVPVPDERPEGNSSFLLPSAAPGAVSATSQKLTLLPPERQQQVARWIVRALRNVRATGSRVSAALGAFLPHLLPSQEPNPWALGSPTMMFIAVLVPLVVVTIASAVYFRYGRSVQYEQYLVQARDARAQALTLSDAVAQREAWQRELFYLDNAESYTSTAETRQLRAEAQQKLDDVLGIRRLQFQPVLSRSVGVQIGRVAAAENDVYLLDAQRASVIHLALTNTGFEVDSAFDCGPGTYGPYSVGPLVDILALPTLNTLNAQVLAVDASGTLLYCSPGQVAQAVPLATPDTNWRRIRSITLDSGNLYVLDAEARAVWVYVGDDSAFVDRPYFFFGGEIPALEDAIDLAVNADDLVRPALRRARVHVLLQPDRIRPDAMRGSGRVDQRTAGVSRPGLVLPGPFHTDDVFPTTRFDPAASGCRESGRLPLQCPFTGAPVSPSASVRPRQRHAGGARHSHGNQSQSRAVFRVARPTVLRCRYAVASELR